MTLQGWTMAGRIAASDEGLMIRTEMDCRVLKRANRHLIRRADSLGRGSDDGADAPGICTAFQGGID
ncbi:MAG TPA: hypothetical protein PK808_02110 [Polymorphobacter sp.]|nr:hypothetical protein [Polymorphobacter sp.]